MTAGITTWLLYVMRFSNDMNVVSLLLTVYPRNTTLLEISTRCYWIKVRREMLFGSTWQSWYVFIGN